MLFRQLFDQNSCTYTYLIADIEAQLAVLVDPVLEQIERDKKLLLELGLKLKAILDTHTHADHITGSGHLNQQTGAHIIVPQKAKCADNANCIDDQAILMIGKIPLKAIATPGHTDAHMAYLINDTHLLTGDSLLIRGCGRTDFQSGDAGTLYDSITQRLFTLPDKTLVYPGHDYQGMAVSTIGEEKRWNPRLSQKTRAEFIDIMQRLDLPEPKKLKIAVPANERSGL